VARRSKRPRQPDRTRTAGRARAPRAGRPASRAAPVFVGALVLILVAGIAYMLLSGNGGARMDPFREAPETVRADLLFLSYLDSLARDQRACPREYAARQYSIGRLTAARAGLSAKVARGWGLYPEAEAGQGELSTLFRELHRRHRLVLPEGDAALWTHIRERQVHVGYLVFGKTPAAAQNQVDFCALITAANRIQPEYSSLLYRHPRTGDLVHGDVDGLPKLAYLGAGRLGDDLAGVYHRYFRLADQRDKQPLF